MPKPETLIVITLIIAIVALGLSIYSTYSIYQINKKVAVIEETLISTEIAVFEFEKLKPQFEVLNEFFPRIQQFLLAVPPISSED